jgi:chemotaxis protein MotB
MMPVMRVDYPFRLAAVLVCVLISAGCSNIQDKPDETQLALQACQQQRVAEQGEWLHKQGQLEKHLEECRLHAREIISDTEAAKLREAELRHLLTRELSEKSVELEYLKGRLTIRMLDRILFDSGSARILPEGKEVLDKLVLAVGKTTDLIRVVGHTDDIRISASLQKTYPSNWELSAARASSVVRYFQEQHGIDPLRMEAVGLSRYHPLSENTSSAARQRNRRVEVILTARDN